MTTAAQKPLRVFCSYSRKDEEYANDLRDSLRGLERQGLIEWWHDREIVPGWEWNEAIDKHLRTADIVLFLVSRAFMASDYVYEQEISRAVERHERGEARVIPVIVRPADWEWSTLGKLQALPKDAKPITTWPDRDEAWLDVVKGVRRAVGDLSRERYEQPVREQNRKVVEIAWADKNLSDEEAERLDALASEQSERKLEIAEPRADTDRGTAEQRAQDNALQAYLDQMSQLLADKGLRNKEHWLDDARVTARARSLTVLRQLSSEHKRSVLQFLYEAQLINEAEKPGPEDHMLYARIVGLSGADLSEANLRYITLEGAALNGANLQNADLREAKLSGIDLGGAFLSGADFSGAYLSKASLREAQLQRKDELNLRGADLSGADLSGADLTDAIVTEEQLATCKSLQGATMPDGTVHD
jgi:uncharacterized protein YjbI with pentapeptide repeats